MKRIHAKELPLSIIVIVGILASAISFVYYFVFDNPYEVIYRIICIVDLLLFTLSAYRLVERFDMTRNKSIIFTALTMLFFIAFFEIIVFAFTASLNIKHTFDLFSSSLRIALFLSPSIILLLPIMVFIAEIIG